MRKAILFAAAILALRPFAHPSPDRAIRQGSIEFTIGSYNMNEPRFEAAYPSGGPIGGLTLSSALAANFNVYLDVKYYSRRGKLTFSQEKTSFYMVPIDLGLRYILTLGPLLPYFGGGFDFYLYYEDNAIGTVLNSTTGAHVMGGAYLRFGQTVPVMINARVQYTWAKAEQDANQVQLGGLEYCLGLAFTY
jgi:hypothetical protein